MTIPRLGLLLFALAMTLPTSAAAEPADTAAAKQAYDRGLEAHKRGDLRTAAEEFARADSLAPSPVALQAALDAAIEADDAPLGAELLARSEREPAPPGLASSVTAAHLKFKGRAGRVRVLCPSDAGCETTIDGKEAEPGKDAWVLSGTHAVVVKVDGKKARTKRVTVEGDDVVEVALDGAASDPTDAEEPEAPPPSPSAREGGLPPIVFYAGAGLTVVLAGVTTYFALDTASQHGSFEDAGCAQASAPPCDDIKSDGESSQTATNVGLVLTGLSAVATVVVGAALTNWKRPLVGVGPGGGALRITF